MTYEELDAEATRKEKLAASMWDSFNRADTQTSSERAQCQGYDGDAKKARSKADAAKP